MTFLVRSKLPPAIRVPDVRIAGVSFDHSAWRSCSGISRVAAHRLGLSVNVWTVNEEADLRRMAEMDCDGIISNYPDVALRVLREVRG